MKITGINEMAAGGSTGAGSIAANPNGSEHRRDRQADREWRDRGHQQASKDSEARSAQTRDQIARAKAAKKKRSGLRAFVARHLLRRNIGEGHVVSFKRLDEAMAMDVNDTLSRLKGLENKNAPDARTTTTYGVEDDDGNIMKITVKSDQADSFEQTLAMSLGELEDQNIYGQDSTQSMSLAELLYNLKNEFDIVDVEFPEIPSDVVYNADKATVGAGNTDAQSANAPMGGDEMGMDDDMGGMEGGDEMGGDMDDGMGADGAAPGGPDMSGMGGEGGGDEMGGEGEDDLDADLGEDMPPDEEAPPTEDSIYQGLIKMFTAQAAADQAKAEAEAEKARALQAEYSAKSADLEMSRQEELARLDADLEQQKTKRKEAKKISDLAKFRVQNAPGKSAQPAQFEGYTSLLNAALGKPQKKLVVEDDSGMLDSEQMIANKKREATQKYAPNQNDTPVQSNYKRQMLQLTMTYLNAQLKMTRLTKQFNMQGSQNQNPQQGQANGNGTAPAVAN